MKFNRNFFNIQDSSQGKIYKKNVRLKSVLTAVAAVLLVCIMIMIGIFFWFRQYIVYTSDGLYLDIPWLEEQTDGQSGQDAG